MHEIGEGELCPRREEKGEDRSGNADGIKEITKGLPRLEDMNGDQKNVNTAKVEGEVIYVVISEGGEDDDLQDLIQNDQACNGKAKTAASLFSAFGVEKATDCRNQNEGDEP